MIALDGSESPGLVYVSVCGTIGIPGSGYLSVLEGALFHCIAIPGLFGMPSYALTCLNPFILKSVDIRLMYRTYIKFLYNTHQKTQMQKRN